MIEGEKEIKQERETGFERERTSFPWTTTSSTITSGRNILSVCFEMESRTFISPNAIFGYAGGSTWCISNCGLATSWTSDLMWHPYGMLVIYKSAGY